MESLQRTLNEQAALRGRIRYLVTNGGERVQCTPYCPPMGSALARPGEDGVPPWGLRLEARVFIRGALAWVSEVQDKDGHTLWSANRPEPAPAPMKARKLAPLADLRGGAPIWMLPAARTARKLTPLAKRVADLWGGAPVWLLLSNVAQGCGCSEASASARLRELRAHGYTVEKMRMSSGLFAYRVRNES